MVASAHAEQDRVLVLMPNARDGERTVHLLAEAGIAARSCDDLGSLCREMEAGAGAVLLTDETIAGDSDRKIESALVAQPAWSALPLLILAREGAHERKPHTALGTYNSVVVLERPVRTRSLLSAVQSALRTRRNQYHLREATRVRERQKAELVAQDEALRFTLSAGRLGSWELDLASFEMTCSETCKANYGRAPGDPFTYDDLRASIHPDDRGAVERAIQRCLETQELYDVEYRVIWPNGERHWVMVRGRAVGAVNGRPTRMLGVSLDITERERLHHALRESEAALAAQAAQLRDADRRKDEFLATLAHELRNPLAPISAGLSLLGGAPDARDGKTLAVMQRQVEHMVRLIDDLLDVSRITRGKLELKREPVKVTKVIEAAIESTLPRIQRGRHTLRTTLPNEPLMLDADFTRTAQIVGNLLNNAAKYTPDAGTIDLGVRREGSELVIEVTDTGLGIAADRLEGIFDMFGQVQGPLDRSDGGLGIGLALVRKLVDMHGGTVEAHSAGLGHGSRFIVRMPLASGTAGAPVRRAIELRADEPGKHVLIADDNQDAAELLGMVLEQAGYRTTIVYDGPSAIAAATSEPPHVVILDIGMGEMSGYEVAERMRKDARFDGTPLIALTGWGTAEDQRKAFAAAFDFHLTKPVGSEALHDALRRAADNRSRAARTIH